MNQRQESICVGTLFAIGLVAFKQLIHAKDNHTDKFDWDTFLLETAFVLIIGIIAFLASKKAN